VAEIEKQSSSPSRWWEFYAVRYGMGTVVGAFACFFLCFNNPILRPLLFSTNGSSFNGARLGLLAAYGLTYCYITSAPILVLHAGRFLWEPTQKNDISLYWWWSLLLLCLVMFLAVDYSCHAQAHVYLTPFFFNMATIVLVLGVGIPLYIATQAIGRIEDMYDFYEILNLRRTSAKGEIIDSYRHLREHGNSFFIVFLEIVFALLLFAAGKYESVMLKDEMTQTYLVASYVAIALLWTFPAVMVWFIAQAFERRFSYR
jgi:hypothetical protein